MSTEVGRPIDKFKRLIESKRGDVKDLLPTHISIEKFYAAATTAAVMNPSIQTCDPGSVLTALMKCAADGLVPDGREAALVPYNSKQGLKAQYLPMVFGVIKQLRNSSEVVSVWSQVVYEGEELTVYVEDGEQKFDHRFDPLRRGSQIVGAYAVAKLKDGTVEFEPMGLDGIEKRRRSSSNQKGDAPTGIWAQWYEEMARKTVIKALAKRLPISSDDLRRVQEIDEQEVKDVTPPPVPLTLTERLKAAQEPPHDPETGEVEDAEVSAPDFDENAVFPGDEVFSEGADAFVVGDPETSNPYASNPAYSNWLAGWRGAQKAAE